MWKNTGQRKSVFWHILRSSVLKTNQKISIKIFHLEQNIMIKRTDMDHKARPPVLLSMKNKFKTELHQKKKKNTSKRQHAKYRNHNTPLLSISFSVSSWIDTSEIKAFKTNVKKIDDV